MNIQRLATEFVIKRAFRHGVATRSDLVKVLGVSTATATRHISAVEILFASAIERKRGGVRPRLLAVPPAFASEEALLHDLDGDRNDPLRTGMFEDELPVVYVSWTNSMPPKAGVLARIVSAIQASKMLKIVYIGLRLGEEPTQRRILPLALERMNDQWRVVAQDIDKPEAPIRVFVLPRILDAEPDVGRAPRQFVHQGHTDSAVSLPVSLNPRFTKAQQQAIARELKVESGKVVIAQRSQHEFGRRFAENPASTDAVWPPLVIKSR